MVSTAEFS